MSVMRKVGLLLALVLLAQAGAAGWGGQGHRLVGLIAASHLTPNASKTVAWLLDNQTLADVSSWADQQVDANQQTSYWHYLNIPPTATGYDRDRDCPRQPGVAAGARADRWRDCAVDRILYHQERLGDVSLDRADRATALKFLVHFVGDLHQPFHALGVGRGGNDVIVRAFGESNCGRDPAVPVPCNLHSIWDSRLIARRGIDDKQYLEALKKEIAANQSKLQSPGTSAEWAVESFLLARSALVQQNANIDEAYYAKHIGVIDRRLALGGLRLAAVLNSVLR
jgi:hypothetical protein